jgi:dipeptidyl aminopeptidase/acylaminoacyl peptidase
MFVMTLNRHLMRTTLFFSGALLAGMHVAGAQQKHVLTFDDFAAVRGVSDPQLSPDGRLVLYTVRTTDVSKNARTSHTYSLPIGGGAAQTFPSDAPDVSATEARWSPDGKHVAFIAGGQLWIADATGAARKQITHLNGGATGPVWAPTSDHVAFTSSVYPDCSNDACNAAKEKTAADNKVKAHVADQLMFRHWNVWDEGTRSHLFVVAIDGSAPRDLIPGAKYDVPPGPFGGSEGYAWSPDARELAYTAKDQGRADATSTDVNVYTISANGGAPTVITAANKGADQNPVYSPDGRYIAYASQVRAGFESDRFRLMVYSRADKKSQELLPSWDRNADAYMWSPDMSGILVQTTDAGRDKLYRAPFVRGGATLRVSGAPQLLVGDHNNASFALSRDGRTVVWLRDATEFPAEVYAADLTATGAANVRTLTHENDSLVSSLAVNPAEDFWFTGAAGVKVQGFVVKPPNWQPGKKYPAILLIHGGPQGAWLDQWHGRWNYQMFAATGAALVIINPRGSFGYGQQFVDDVSKGWGGKGLHGSHVRSRRRDLEESVDRPQRPRSRRRIVRWIHGELDRGAHEPLQGARVACRSVQPREHGDGDGRALVPRLGVRRPVLGREGDGQPVSRVLAAPLREELQDADARDRRRARLPRALHGRLVDVHVAAAHERTEPASHVPRRRTLGTQAAESASVVGRSAGVDEEISRGRPESLIQYRDRTANWGLTLFQVFEIGSDPN